VERTAAGNRGEGKGWRAGMKVVERVAGRNEGSGKGGACSMTAEMSEMFKPVSSSISALFFV